MSKTFGINEIKSLMKRAYNSSAYDENKKLSLEDADAIKALCQQTFCTGSTPLSSAVESFNNILVEVIDDLVKPELTEILNFIADFQQKDEDAQGTRYVANNDIHTTMVWVATGTGVDVKRMDAGSKDYVQPQEFKTGFYYEKFSNSEDVVEKFKKLVDDGKNAVIRLFMTQTMKLAEASLANGTIPATQILSGANLMYTDLVKIGERISRNGGKPLMLADVAMINAFADSMISGGAKELLTDGYRDELRESLCPKQLGRITALPIANPYVNKKHTKVQFPINVGYMVGTSDARKPFVINKFGGLRQVTVFDEAMDGRYEVILIQRAGFACPYAENLAYIKDTAIQL